jgi:glutamate carboxypeptidase
MRLTADEDAILAAIHAAGDALVARAVAWCDIASGSRNLPGLEAQRSALQQTLSALPGRLESLALAHSIEIGPSGEAGAQHHTAALRLTVRPEAPVQVVLTGHYDTVYPERSLFQTVVRRPDGALNGPGIADMKGGISVMLGALEAFDRHPLASRVGYVVLLSPDEEIGSPASAPLLTAAARNGHVGLTYEPCLPDGSLVDARKGSGNFHVVVSGRAAHAGRDFSSGRNALAAAADLAARLHALNGEREGVTLNIGRIDGGGPLNVVPGVAVLRFNVRVPNAAAADWCLTRITALLSSADAPADVTMAIHGGFHRPAKPVDAAQGRLMAAVEQVGALLGQPIAWRASGGVCEGNNLYAAGLPNIDTLGVRGGDIHSDAEYAWPESFVQRAQLSAALLMKLASGEIDTEGLGRTGAHP